MAAIARTYQVRIIGGRWRGRKLRFPDLPQLRPSPDRVRETLFNWLAPELAGACCLDLFAGSGALGLEALSRGASEVTLVERNPRIVAVLRQHAQSLGAGPDLRIQQADAISYLRGAARQMDIVFIDPPFRAGLYEKLCSDLSNRGWLKPRAWVYVESDRHTKWSPPADWCLHRRQDAGQVQGNLFRIDGKPV